jgi:hypothetical protein
MIPIPVMFVLAVAITAITTTSIEEYLIDQVFGDRFIRIFTGIPHVDDFLCAVARVVSR